MPRPYHRKHAATLADAVAQSVPTATKTEAAVAAERCLAELERGDRAASGSGLTVAGFASAALGAGAALMLACVLLALR